MKCVKIRLVTVKTLLIFLKSIFVIHVTTRLASTGVFLHYVHRKNVVNRLLWQSLAMGGKSFLALSRRRVPCECAYRVQLQLSTRFYFVFFFLDVFPIIPKLVLFLSFVRFWETRISSTIMRIFKLVATCSRKSLLPPQGFRPEGEIPRRHSSNSRVY